MPVKLEDINAEDAIAFARHVNSAPGKVLAHCRTGTRSATLWALSQAGKMPADEILATTKKLGYDLEALRGRLR